MPKIIMHNQVSLDGSVSGFKMDPVLYYGIVNEFEAEMYLVGSNTALLGIETFSKNAPHEESTDFNKPESVKNDHTPLWVIPDSEGKLEGWLHVYRRHKHCRDVVILLTQETPKSYINYLTLRKYNYIIAGKQKVQYNLAFEKLHEQFHFKTMVTDNSGVLSSILLENGLIDQISMLVSPTLTGKKPPKLFRELTLGKRVIKLFPQKASILPNNDILLLFDVIK